MTDIPRDDRQRLHAEAIAEYTCGDRTTGQLDLETYLYGPDDQPSPHPLAEKHLGRQPKALAQSADVIHR